MSDFPLLDEIVTNLHELEIDEIKERLEPLWNGMSVETPIFDPSMFVYRARIVNSTFNKANGINIAALKYPPKGFASAGRLNRAGDPMFYCSTSKAPIFFELPDLKAGDEIILSFWKTTEKMVVNNIGYTNNTFEKLGAKRACPEWRNPDVKTTGNSETITPLKISNEMLTSVKSTDENHLHRDALSQHFTYPVGPSEKHLYKLTTAIAEKHLGDIEGSDLKFAGILYPSVRMWANGDNLALLPWFVDAHLEFRKALHIRIDSRDDQNVSIIAIDSAKQIDEKGNLVWLGRLPNWTLNRPFQKAIFVVTVGQDNDGDYETGKDGSPCHWVATDADTGELIERG